MRRRAALAQKRQPQSKTLTRGGESPGSAKLLECACSSMFFWRFSFRAWSWPVSSAGSVRGAALIPKRQLVPRSRTPKRFARECGDVGGRYIGSASGARRESIPDSAPLKNKKGVGARLALYKQATPTGFEPWANHEIQIAALSRTPSRMSSTENFG